MREGLFGWATEPLVRLDDEVPGVLSRVLTAAPERREAILCAVAVHNQNCGLNSGDELIERSLAEVVRHGRSADILRHALGEIPEGLRGLLSRIQRPLPRSKDYLALCALAASDDGRGMAALLGSGSISVRKLEVLAALDARWRHTNTLERIDTGAEALMFNAAVGFIQSVNSRATDEVVADAIAAMRPTSTLPRLLDRFMLRADRLPEHPVPFEDNELRPLRTARSVLAAGRRYRNCLRHRVSDVAAGKMALSKFRGECLVEFRGTTSGVWLLREVHVERNRPVALALCAAVEAKCDALGIPRFCDEAGSGWKSYRKFTGELEWG